MSNREREWNKYEAVILLDGYLSYKEKSVPKKTVIKEVSQKLREMAYSQGEEIDDTFRNENGISFQLKSMESAFYGHTVDKPATKLFSEVVNLYRTNRQEYDKLLDEANSMINKISSCETDFKEYLSTKVSSKELSELWRCYGEIEQFAKLTNILNRPLFETTSYAAIKKVCQMVENNKFFRVTHKKHYANIIKAIHYYFAFIQEREESKKHVKEITFTSPKLERQELEQEQEKEIPLARTNDDERLLSKYPVIYKRLFNVLQDESPNGLTINQLHERTNHVARVSDIETILDNVSWADNDGINYWFSTNVVNHNIEKRDEGSEKFHTSIEKKLTKIDKQEEQLVDFENLKDLSDTTPLYFIYFGEQSKNYASWNELYVGLLNVLYDDYPTAFSAGAVFSNNKSRMDVNVIGHSAGMENPQILPGTSLIVETAGTAEELMEKIKYLLIVCAVDYENVQVAFQKVFVKNEEPRTNIDRGVLAKSPTYHNEKYEKILKERFKNGFRMNSSLELRRFKKYFNDEYGIEPLENDDEISNIIKRLCVLVKDRAYLPEVMLTDDLKQQILDYIETSFEDGKVIIYYQAICSRFTDELLYSPIHDDADALKAYLSKEGDGHFYIHNNFVSRDKDVKIDTQSEVRNCIQAMDRPVKFEEICSMLPHLPEEMIKAILTNNSEFINNGSNEYFHEESLHISDEDLENITQIIEITIEEKAFIGGNELYDAIQLKYPNIIDDNPGVSTYGFREALKNKLKGRFAFKGNIISRAGEDLSMTEVFADFARMHDSFTIDELQLLADELSTPIYYTAVYENSLRVSQNQFVSKEQVQFPIDEVDRAMDPFCPGNYMSIKDVSNFAAFPYVGFPWNEYLVEHYVAYYSKKYKLVDTGFSKTTCVGAIVKRSSGINDFDEVIVQVLVNSDIELNHDSALDLLKNKGYIAKRSYSNIDKLIIRARALRK